MLPLWAASLRNCPTPRLVLSSLGPSSIPHFIPAVSNWMPIHLNPQSESAVARERPNSYSVSISSCCQQASSTQQGVGGTPADCLCTTCDHRGRQALHRLAALQSAVPHEPDRSSSSRCCRSESRSNCSSYNKIVTYNSSCSNRRYSNRVTNNSTRGVQPVAFSSLPNVSALHLEGTTAFSELREESRSPQALVKYLDEYIVGQTNAKNALAVALRQRWRRRQVKDPALRGDICPRNILLIGPTGVGKTEIARRLAVLLDAPFIKVEATKYTEVGFHGRDVEQIIKDLMEVAVKQKQVTLEKQMKCAAAKKAETKVLAALLGKVPAEEYTIWLRHLRRGALNNQRVELDLPLSAVAASNQARVFGDVQDAASNMTLNNISSLFAGDLRMINQRCVTIKDAIHCLTQAELDVMVTKEMVVQQAVEAVEEEGIVFIDEIDKICSKSGKGGYQGPDASDEGVQRDLLPLLEGSTVSTRYGDIHTNYILFIASGAFHSVQPSDMLAELQGRLPVRVLLRPLSEKDFYQILTRTKSNLIEQHKALLATEGIELKFTDDAITEVARVSSEINSQVENIGARRLHTIIEKVLEDINLNAALQPPGTTVLVDRQYVVDSVKAMRLPFDLSRSIL